MNIPFLNELFGTIIRFFCTLCGNNYALGILVFTVIVNAALLPLNIKQQKSTAAQARMKNKLAKLQEKYKDDKQKYQEEMSKLYSEGGTSPFSGCLLMLIRFPIFICIYDAVRQTLSYVYGADSKLIKSAFEVIKSGALGSAVDKSKATEISVLKNIDALIAHDAKFADLTKGLELDFSFFGINLLDTPTSALALIWIIPLLSFATAMLSSFISMQMSKKTNPGANMGSMGCMMFGMPFFSLWITFSVPGAVGWYWVCSNIVSTIIMVCMNKIYFPAKLVAQQEAKEARKRRAWEQERINPPASGKKGIIKK